MKMHASVWLLLAGVLLLAGCAQSAEVTVNRTITYQTSLGWGATSYIADFINPRLYPQLLDDAVEQMGLTRLRFEIPTHEWGTDVNDNSNLSHLNLAAFHTTDTDRKMTQLLLPFKQRVEASGSTFTSYISPSFFDNGSSGEAPAWLLNSPAEYTVWATAYLRYLKRQYAFTPTYYCICNEAGNGNAFTPDRLVAIGKVLGPQLRADGLPTLLEAPECMSPAQTWDYLNVMKNDADIWPYIGLISYHLYGDLARRADIRDFARARNIPTAQTEFMGTTIDHLFDDLIDGGVSTWEHYGLAGGAIGNGTYYQLNANGTGFHYYPQSRNFRQIMHYVRPGDIRVDANCADPALRTLAFMRKGQVTLVVYNTGATTNLTVHSLPTGPYGVSQTVQMSPWQERGIQTVKDGNMTLTIPQKTVLTIYPYVGKNEAPIITDSASFPVVLQLPQQHISLHVTATDPELDPLTYNWRITAQPTGVVATLATPTAPNTTVDGLSRAGEYVFTVTVSDGIRTTSRELIQTVYADNQPPMIGDLSSRECWRRRRHLIAGLMLSASMPSHDFTAMARRWSSRSADCASRALRSSPSLSQRVMIPRRS